MAHHDSGETYLKAVFALQTTGRAVTTSALAEHLGVTAPSVSGMVKRLEARGLVRRTGARGMALTRAGEARALGVVRRHRLLETYLHRALGVPWDEVHAEAESLEGALSSRLEERIDAALGHPRRDPHGDPIPPRSGAHVEAWGEPLDAVADGARVRVDRVADRDPAALRHLAALGITPGAEVTVEARDPFGGPLWLRVGRRRHAVGPELARTVFVSPTGSAA